MNYFTVTATDFYYGRYIFEKGKTVRLIKEPDNEHDPEAIRVEIKGLGRVGYVANSVHTVMGQSLSAGRLYDKIGKKQKAEWNMSPRGACSVHLRQIHRRKL